VNKKLSKDLYLREDTLAVARDLIGKLIVVPNGRERVSAMIVETEAYLGEIDKAAHSFGGRRTKRTEVMYAAGGTVYVFFVYGMYHQLNVVTGPVDHPHAILIRAAEPVEGIETIRERRGKMTDRNLTSGPGKLCIALGVDKTFNGENFRGRRIWLEHFREFDDADIIAGPRIGIAYAEEFVEMPWRFRLKDNPFVSAGQNRPR
jgi:DNA-3-methyladenine glycosylase